VTVVAAPVVLSAVGFTGAGIAASSIASSMMSAAAITNGGGVAAGGLVATLQSAGAAGLSASSKALLGAVGSAVGGWIFNSGGLQCVLVAGSMSFAQAGMLACSLASKVMSAASLASAGGAASGSVLAGLSKVGSALHAQGALAQALSTLGPLLGTLKGSSVLASSATVLRASPLAVPRLVCVCLRVWVRQWLPGPPRDTAPVSTAATVAAAPVVLSAVGFTSSGIAASSLAAKMMSVAAIANGGGVAAGSLVATLQSAGQCPGAGGGGRAALTREHAGPVETLTASLSSSPWASLWGFCGHALAGRSSGLVCAGSGSGPDTRLGGWVLSARLSQSCSRS
ncbi:Interferon alpha-inducible protein 27, mitochondrial, partial [Galemys pyrenaicus]